MRIGFCGAHGTGKTTTAKELQQLRSEFNIVPSTARLSLAAGYKINRDADPDSQLFTMVARIAKEDQSVRQGDTVSDRTPLDSLAYAQYQRDNVWQHDTDFYYEMCWELTKTHMQRYGLLYYFPIYWLIESDGVRDPDVEYQRDIDGRVQKLLHELEVQYIQMPNVNASYRAQLIDSDLGDKYANV